MGLPSPSLLRNATSPKGRGFGRPGNFPLDAQGPIWRKRAGLATEGRPVLVQPLRRFAPAPLVGEPLAKPFTLRGLPKPPLQGEVASRSDDGEVVRRQSLSFAGKSGSPHRFLYLFAEVYGILVLRPCPPILFGREVKAMSSILSFVLSVGANVTSYYICKWLDRWFTGRKH